jgi:hypothetical protein
MMPTCLANSVNKIWIGKESSSGASANWGKVSSPPQKVSQDSPDLRQVQSFRNISGKLDAA